MADAQAQAHRTSSMFGKIARMTEVTAERTLASKPDEPTEPALSAEALCAPAAFDECPDFLVPCAYDICPRDSQAIMDVAVFRLSKNTPRKDDLIRYDLPDGHVQVKSEVHGMATVWDYDIVLMIISHITKAMNRFRDGKGPKPGKYFRPRVSEVLKFCKRANGGKQRDLISGALDRLATTFVSIQRTRKIKNEWMTIDTGENLIASRTIISSMKTGKVEFIEVKIADWMYREIVDGQSVNVLSLSPDYFLIDKGIGRFIYRLARQKAGKESATWGFNTLYKRSGSAASYNGFCQMLRKLIRLNDLPEYSLVEVMGKKGPMLVMTYRGKSDSDTEESIDQ